MAEYIERETVLKMGDNVINVIRCKDCKYCEIIIDQFDNDWYFCTKSANNAEVKADDYCSYGVRKEDEGK